MRAETVRRIDGRRLTYYRVGDDPVGPEPAPEAAPAVLVTGGAGFVGGSFVRCLVQEGVPVVVLDDLATGHVADVPAGVDLVVAEVGDIVTLREIFAARPFRAVFHFAAASLVSASMRDPLAYYRTNVAQGLRLIEEVVRSGGPPLILSSSAAVYGVPGQVPIPEDAPLAPVNPYGETKRVLEQALRWAGEAYGLRWAALRYFNAAGAIVPGGPPERHDPETHLIPNVLAAADGGPELVIAGNDYPTPDGTAIRDYIHVGDLASGHQAALRYLESGGPPGAFNLGTGSGHSVSEVVAVAAEVVGRPVPWRFGPRRPGDPPVLVADIARSGQVLGWHAERSSLREIIASAWQARGVMPRE